MPKKPPKYALHKPTGQARVRINGKSHYLGPHGSPESHKRYDALIAKWLNGTFDGDRESLTPDPRLHATTAVDRTFARISISRTKDRKRRRTASSIGHVTFCHHSAVCKS